MQIFLHLQQTDALVCMRVTLAYAHMKRMPTSIRYLRRTLQLCERATLRTQVLRYGCTLLYHSKWLLPCIDANICGRADGLRRCRRRPTIHSSAATIFYTSACNWCSQCSPSAARICPRQQMQCWPLKSYCHKWRTGGNDQ